MRIYLACTVRGDRGGLDIARALCARLQSHGHIVLTTHLLDDNVDDAESALTEREVYDRDIAWLDSCDLLVAEASGSSYGVGFEVGYVLGRSPHAHQRVVVLYDTERTHRLSRLLLGNAHSSCTTYGYGRADDLLTFIDRYLDRS
jgi:2'-deoxynucleoside 5'-phosphate N-hydrolase